MQVNETVHQQAFELREIKRVCMDMGKDLKTMVDIILALQQSSQQNQNDVDDSNIVANADTDDAAAAEIQPRRIRTQKLMTNFGVVSAAKRPATNKDLGLQFITSPLKGVTISQFIRAWVTYELHSNQFEAGSDETKRMGELARMFYYCTRFIQLEYNMVLARKPIVSDGSVVLQVWVSALNAMALSAETAMVDFLTRQTAGSTKNAANTMSSMIKQFSKIALQNLPDLQIVDNLTTEYWKYTTEYMLSLEVKKASRKAKKVQATTTTEVDDDDVI